MQGNVSKVKITPEIAEKLKELREENIFLDGLAKVQNIGENRSKNGPTTTGTVVFNDDGYTLTGVCDVRRWVNNCPVGQAVGGDGTTLSLEIDLPGGNGGRIFYVYSQEQGVEGRNPMFGFAYTTQGYRLLSNFSTSLSNDQYYNDKIYKGTVSVWVFIKGGDFELYVNEERITKISTGTNLANRWYYGFRTYLGTEAVTIKNMKYSKGNAVRKTFYPAQEIPILPEEQASPGEMLIYSEGELMWKPFYMIETEYGNSITSVYDNITFDQETTETFNTLCSQICIAALSGEVTWKVPFNEEQSAQIKSLLWDAVGHRRLYRLIFGQRALTLTDQKIINDQNMIAMASARWIEADDLSGAFKFDVCLLPTGMIISCEFISPTLPPQA